MKKENVKQLKLVSGDEIICEVVDWDEESEGMVVVRNMYQIISTLDIGTNSRYYSLKPYMSFQLGENLYQTINEYHIMSTALPVDMLINQYQSTIKIEKLTSLEVEKEFQEKLKQMQEYMEDELSLGEGLDEEELTNVLQFPPKDKLH